MIPSRRTRLKSLYLFLGCHACQHSLDVGLPEEITEPDLRIVLMSAQFGPELRSSPSASVTFERHVGRPCSVRPLVSATTCQTTERRGNGRKERSDRFRTLSEDDDDEARRAVVVVPVSN